MKLNITNDTNDDFNLSDEYVKKVQSYIENDEFNISIGSYDLPEKRNETYNITLDGNILTIEFEGNFTTDDKHQTEFPATVDSIKMEGPEFNIGPVLKSNK